MFGYINTPNTACRAVHFNIFVECDDDRVVVSDNKLLGNATFFSSVLASSRKQMLFNDTGIPFRTVARHHL